jgi:hypothetical protein
MTIADNRESTYSTTTKHGMFHDILHDLRKSLRGEVHSLAEIRQEMSRTVRSNVKLTEVLKRHHDYMKESLVVCLDRDSADSDKQFHLDRLLQLFEMHSKAEEQTLYKLLIASSEKDPRIEGNMAQDEHELIFRVMDELRDMHFMSLWTEDVEAKSLMLCELIANHFKKEEKEIFPLANNSINSAQLNDLTGEYINLCETYLGMSEIRAKGIFL